MHWELQRTLVDNFMHALPRDWWQSATPSLYLIPLLPTHPRQIADFA